MSKDWIAIKKEQLDEIKELKPTDRLDMVEAMALMNQHIASSCQGWAQWLYNLTIINRLDEEKLKDVYSRFRKVTLDFLEFDVKSTEKLKPPVKKLRKERPQLYG